EGCRIVTVEGLSRDGSLDRLQESFLRHGAAQCGACTPGMLVAAHALLATRPRPDRSEIEVALGGVLWRCTGYARIIDAVVDAAGPGPVPALARKGGVGEPALHVDGPAKVTGLTRFGADVLPEGALLARIVRSPHAHARFSLGDVEA